VTGSGSIARVIRSGSRCRGTVLLPPSKSVTNRALALALLGDRPIEILRPLDSQDTRALTVALERLGFEIDKIPAGLALRPGRRPESAEIDCGASGTMLRFLTAVLATRAGVWTLDGVARLRERPLGALIDALRVLGADIDCLETAGFAPLRIRGGTLRGGRCRLDAGTSSQFLSAVLMASVRAQKGVSIEASALTSAPYVELTLRAMADFGYRVRRSGSRYEVEPQASTAKRFEVEADYSSACYFGAAAALTGGRVTLAGLRLDSAQGDARFFSVLERMGAGCSWSDGSLEVVGPERPMTAVSENFSDMPDQVPTLAVLAPFAEGTTRITGVGHLRLKESDRLAVVARQLERSGLEGVEETEAGIAVPGVWARDQPPSRPVAIDTADDHRIAMSFALLGLRRSGISISEPGVVAKSYPNFWEDFGAVCQQ
jgi:3-phosphoshikimate 1-carboxyvinyltransferase